MEGDGERRILEDINITPFFDRHSGHMPASVSLHAEVVERSDTVVLEMEHPGLSEGEVKVEGDVNAIRVRICFDECPDSYFTNTYITPSPVDSDRIKVDLQDGRLVVTAPKIVEED